MTFLMGVVELFGLYGNLLMRFGLINIVCCFVACCWYYTKYILTLRILTLLIVVGVGIGQIISCQIRIS